NDGGGSVRSPAAVCGLVGLKPGRGRMPDDDPTDSVRNLMTSGPIASTAEDAALLFDVMAGHRFTADSSRRGRRHRPVPAQGPAQRAVHAAMNHGLKPLSVAVTAQSPFSDELTIDLADDA